MSSFFDNYANLSVLTACFFQRIKVYIILNWYWAYLLLSFDSRTLSWKKNNHYSQLIIAISVYSSIYQVKQVTHLVDFSLPLSIIIVKSILLVAARVTCMLIICSLHFANQLFLLRLLLLQAIIFAE